MVWFPGQPTKAYLTNHGASIAVLIGGVPKSKEVGPWRRGIGTEWKPQVILMCSHGNMEGASAVAEEDSSRKRLNAVSEGNQAAVKVAEQGGAPLPREGLSQSELIAHWEESSGWRAGLYRRSFLSRKTPQHLSL